MAYVGSWSPSRMAGLWYLAMKERKPGVDYLQNILNMDPETMQGLLGAYQPYLENWATSQGVYNPAEMQQRMMQFIEQQKMGAAGGLLGTQMPGLPQKPISAGTQGWMGAAESFSGILGSLAGLFCCRFHLSEPLLKTDDFVFIFQLLTFPVPPLMSYDDTIALQGG